MLWDFHVFLLGFSVGVLGNLLTALVDRKMAIRLIPWVAFYSVFSALSERVNTRETPRVEV